MGSAVLTAEQMAGCGPGLTPSSDDFLCGYVASWPDEKPWKGFLKEITNAAALKTNDISGSFVETCRRKYVFRRYFTAFKRI